MIVEQKCNVIVQLCQNQEDGKEKCYDYIPKKQRNFGSVNVRIKEEPMKITALPSVRRTVVEATFKGSTVQVSDFQNMNHQIFYLLLLFQVCHYLYDGWPDHDVPLSPKDFSQLRTMVHAQATTKQCPVVVHCSAGIGK